jgi:alpha-1,6-mannosyltransferase
VPAPRLRVVDVALFYGERSGGIRTYLEAKRAWAAATGAYEHHVVTPHDVPSLRVATPNGYRVPVGVGALRARLRELAPDVVLLHDPFWGPQRVIRTAHELGAHVVAVHHGSVALTAASVPVPGALVRPALRRWLRGAYAEIDSVMSAVPTYRDAGRRADLRLRFGLDPAFRPRAEVERRDHVLYAGRLALEKGVLELVDAVARTPYPLRVVGTGPLREAVAARARARGVRVTFAPYVTDRDALAREYAAARVVCMPGAHETFGLAGFEAAACGARVVCCTTAPSARVVADLGHTFGPGDGPGLARALTAAWGTAPDHAAAGRMLAEHSWPAALRAELADLRARLAA